MQHYSIVITVEPLQLSPLRRGVSVAASPPRFSTSVANIVRSEEVHSTLGGIRPVRMRMLPR